MPNSLFAYAPLVIAFPLLGLLVNLSLGRRMGERGVGGVATAAIGLSFLAAGLQFLALQAEPQGRQVWIADWIVAGDLDLPWALRVDTLAVTMMLMVTGVSTLIHLYAVGYMHDDVRFQGDPGRYRRFFVYFNLFVAAMLILVSADNFLMLFVGWEGVGLCSYLLIGFWYEKGEAGIGNALAGKKAFVVNRIGDFGFLIALLLIFTTFGSLHFEPVFHAVEELGAAEAGVITAITLFLLVGVTGKSAQLPLYVWLPDAMAGPTPVSALIHAATMVTAGIYMIARTHVLFEAAPFTAGLVALLGAATAFFAATIAVGQYDIKRVLAYSTISQLGFMVAAVGIGAYVAGMFHLLTHAFFKALLFLSAGSVILGLEHGVHAAAHGRGDDGHAGFDPNDMRLMGGLRGRMGKTFVLYLIGGLGLAGIPPLAGFFSKDEILADARHHQPVVYALLLAAAFLTAFYISRQIFLVFFGRPRSPAAGQAHESPPIILAPLAGLAGLVLIGGGLNLPGLHSLARWLAHSLGELELSAFDPSVALTSVGLALAAFALAWWLYGRRPLEAGAPDPLRRALGPIYRGMEQKWWVDELYQALFVRTYQGAARFLTEVVENRWWHDAFHDRVLAGSFRGLTRWMAEAFDLRVVDGTINRLAGLTQAAASRLGILQSGYVRSYALSLFVGAVLLLSYFLLR